MRAWFSAGVLGLFLAGCGGSAAPGSDDPAGAGRGQVRVSLAGTGSDGVEYRVVGWSLRFDGPESQVIDETNVLPEAILLKAGSYAVSLEGSWHVERVDDPGVPVEVLLVSPNPLNLVVLENQDNPLRFIFKLPSTGSAAVTMGVDAGGWLSGTFTLDGTDDPSGSHTFDSLLGVPVPFTISYDYSRITRNSYFVDLTGPVTVQFGGAPSAVLNQEFALALSGQNLYIELGAGTTGIQPIFGPFVGALGPVTYRIELDLPEVPGSLDANGAPQLQPFTAISALRLVKSTGYGDVIGSGLATVEVVPR